MSGRKKSEVTTVLRNASSTRQDIFDRYKNSISRLLKETGQLQGKADKALPQLPRFDPAVSQYFPSQSKRILSEYQKLMESAVIDNISIETEKTQFNAVTDRIQNIDRSVNSLEKRLGSKSGSHYFDSEYEEAARLLREYQELRGKLASLQNILQKKQDIGVLKERQSAMGQKQADELVKEARSLNEMAAKRREQDEIKALTEESQKLFSAIAPDLAEKFACAEYDRLGKNQAVFEKSGAKVLKTHAGHFAEIEHTADLVRERHRVFREQKAAADVKMKSVVSVLESLQYTNPVNPDETLDAEEFCSDVLDDPKRFAPIEAALDSMQEYYDNEQFTEAKNAADRLEAALEQLQDDLDNSHIRIREQIQTALAIEDVLQEMGYETHTDFEDGKISQGIVVRTGSPETIAMHLKHTPKGTESGEPDEEKIDIQFHLDESDCAPTAQEISGRLKQMGIPFNVTDWGTAQQKKKQQVPDIKQNRAILKK